MYTAEIYFSTSQGTPATKVMPAFDARNLNHAIRRMVKTITNTGKYGMHTRFNVWCDDGQAAHVYVNQVMGQHAGVTIDGTHYGPTEFVSAFQG